MNEFFQALVLLLGYLAGHALELDEPCHGAACPDVVIAPFAACAVPQTLSPREVRVWSRSEFRPGVPEREVWVLEVPGDGRAPVLVLRAEERIRLAPIAPAAGPRPTRATLRVDRSGQ